MAARASGDKPPHRIVTTPLAKRLTITVELDGAHHVLVQTSSALLLAETGYPVRYYFPRQAVQAPFRPVRNAEKETYCPFKGFARYYHAEVALASGDGRTQTLRNLFWSYARPFEGSHAQAVAGLLCVDAPSEQLQIKVDDRSVSLRVARELNDKIIKASRGESSLPSPSQSRPADQQHLSPGNDRPALMRRSTSSDQQPMVPPHAYGFTASADLQFDSADPLLTDLVYRLDDQHRPFQEASAEADDRLGSGETTDDDATRLELDPHLAWARDLPWYKRPSEKWLRPFAFLLALAAGMCMGPKLELFNALVCEQVLGRAGTGNVTLGEDRPIRAERPASDGLASLVGFDTYQTWPQTGTVGYEEDKVGIILSFHVLPADSVAALDVNRTVNEPDRPSKSCLGNPQVQSSLAALQLRLTLSMGILAALTTGFWSNLSSRIGRLAVLRLAILGFLCTDLATITVGLVPRSQLPGGVNFLLIGTTIEGLLGGYGTAIAVHQLYISDATPSGTRAHIFAHFMGIFSAGIAIGPTLGGMLVKHTGKILSPFYFALGMHVLYALFVGFIMPESTSPAARQKAAEEHEANKAEIRRKAEERKAAVVADVDSGSGERRPLLSGETGDAGPPAPVKPWKKRVWKRIKVAFVASVLHAPLEPLTILLPKKVRVRAEEEEQQRAGIPLRSELAHPEASASHISVSHVAHKMRYDTNLFYLSLTYFVESSIIGILTFKMQYAQQRFLWDSAQLGIYLSFAGLTRVLALGLVLPLVIKLLHRPVKALNLPQDGLIEDEEGDQRYHDSRADASLRRRSMLDAEGRVVVPDSASQNTTDGDAAYGTFREAQRPSTGKWDAKQKSVEELWTLRAKHLRLIHDSRFDLKLTRISIAVNTLAYGLLIFSSTPFLFFFASGLTSLGGGGGAAMSSLALALLESPSDAGKLFGAWSILSAIASTIVGPLLFGKVFEATTDVFVGAIFVVGTAMFVVSFLILALVRVRKPVSLPSLPARPPPPPGAAATATGKRQPDVDAASTGTWRSAFSMRTRRAKGTSDGAEAGKQKRPAVPFARE